MARQGYRWFRGGWQPSAAERRVLDALVAGGTNAEIAVRLGLSPETVKSHIGRMLAETGSADRAALARWWQGRAARRPVLLPWLGRTGKIAATAVAAGLGVLLLVAGAAAVRRVVTTLPPRGASVALELPTPTPTPRATPAATPPPPAAVRVEAEIPVGDEPFFLAVGAGAVWVPNRQHGTLVRLDPSTDAVVATIPIGDPRRGGLFTGGPVGMPTQAIVAEGFIWVTKEDEGAIAQVDPRSNTVVGVIPIGVAPHRMAAGRGTLWVTSREEQAENSVIRVDLASRRVVATIPMATPNGIVVTDEAVWVANGRQDTVTRIDPRTNTIAAVVSFPGPGSQPNCSLCVGVMAATEGAVWVGYTPPGERQDRVARIDAATNQIVAMVPVSPNPFSGAADERCVWIVHFGSKSVTRIDPGSNTVTGESYVGYQLGGIALDGDTAWLTSHSMDTLLRVKLLP